MSKEFESRISIAEAELQGLKVRTEALTEMSAMLRDEVEARQKLRTDRVGLYAGALQVAVVIVFGYQLYNAASMSKQMIEADQKIQQAQKTISTLEEQRVVQSSVVGKLVKDVVQLSVAYRDAAVGRQGFAAIRAEEVLSDLREHERLALIDNNPKAIEVLPTAQQEQLRLMASVMPALKETLVAAYELKARCYFQLYDKDKFPTAMAIVEDCGQKVQKLDSTDWEGYHFVGLALTASAMAKKNLGKGTDLSKQEIEKVWDSGMNAITQSIQIGGRLSVIDMLNMSETLLEAQKFSDAKNYSLLFKGSLGPLIAPEHVIVCDIIETVADYSATGNPVSIKKLIVQASTNSKKIQAKLKWFGWGDLLEFAEQLMKEYNHGEKTIGPNKADKSLIYDLIVAYRTLKDGEPSVKKSELRL